MSYNIVQDSAVSFVDKRNIKFPRFQRKQTWDAKDNFKLCISIFKGYPIGVVIVNSQNGSDYLLDGRQRRNALKLMRDDPKSVYLWAKKFVNFSPSCSEEELKEKFWNSIDDYLQHDAAKSNEEKIKENEEDDYEYENESGNENSYDFEKQYNSLKTLLDLVLICHPMKNNETNLQKCFKFGGFINVSDLEYAEPVNGEYVINPTKLKKYIDKLIEDEVNNWESLSESLIRRYKITGNTCEKIRKYIQQHWEYYSRCMETIGKINDVLNDARVGMIALTNADILDAQNIFSLVNASGTPLSAEELLSARPFWNVALKNPSSELLDYKKEMYKFLGIDLPSDTCRWDLCSTFLKRIDKNSLIFENEKNSFTTSISLSYRIISAILVGGINNTAVTSLEKLKIDWEVEIESIIKDINMMISLLEDVDYFKYLMRWKQSIMSLTSNSIAIEFCAVMYKVWKYDLGKPTKSSSNISEFNRKAVYLFDKLIYEYCLRIWTGSSDSLVAAHLRDYSNRFELTSSDEWIKYIDEISTGQYKGKPTTSKTLKPFIYNYYFLRKIQPNNLDINTSFEIDHLIAQKLFKDNDQIDIKYKDNFMNFSILPKGENIEKLDKKLIEIHDEWLIEQIKIYADIDDEDIKALSDLSKIVHLEKRKESYIEAYKDYRNKILSNLK